MDFKKFLSRDLSVIKKELNVEILKRKNNCGDTILHYLFWFLSNPSLEKIKYTLKYCCKKYPSLFLEKNNYESTILHNLFYNNHSLETIKYVFDYCIKNYPYLFLEKNIDGDTILYNLGKNGLKFLKYNFPEISENTNNFILPLMIEIQN